MQMIESVVSRMAYRDSIKPGDVLVWEKDRRSAMSTFLLDCIRVLTVSDYAHTATAIRQNGKLCVVEASMPEVRVTPIVDIDEFYHIPLRRVWTPEAEEFLLSKVGLRYSFPDAVRGYLGMTVERDNSYQCAELTNEVCSMLGINMGNAFTPTKVVKTLIRQEKTGIFLCPSLLV